MSSFLLDSFSFCVPLRKDLGGRDKLVGVHGPDILVPQSKPMLTNTQLQIASLSPGVTDAGGLGGGLRLCLSSCWSGDHTLKITTLESFEWPQVPLREAGEIQGWPD